MRDIADKHQNRLKELKQNVRDSYKYFEHNIKRFHEFTQFVYSTSLTEEDMSKLEMLQKPAIEFNVLEAYVSRQRGEFAEHEPSMKVSMADGLMPSALTPQLVEQIRVIECHIRDIFDSAENDGLEGKVYNDILSGGFSAVKVFTDYISEMSFEQKICVERVFDPTLCGFDPMARGSHKGDGNFCFEIIPRLKEDFEKEHGKKSTEGMTFARNLEGFSWSFENNNTKIMLIADYYEKKRKKEKIAKLSNGKTILSKHYPQLLELWEAAQLIEQPPIIIEERMSHLEYICRYQFCENKVLSYIETDYRFLPLVFVDGNSVMLQQKGNGAMVQMTRPYVYQAKGVQKLKNFAGQSIACEIENMVQHKFIACAEGIPEDYRDAYKNIQQAQVLVFNAFSDGDVTKPLPPPREVQRTPTPLIVQETFMGTDAVTQTILGSYDAQMGIVGGQISGKAIQQGSMHSSAAAKPYLINYVKGLNRVAQIILDLIPKYYVTPRSIPIRQSNGMRSHQIINDSQNKQSIKISYKPHDLQVKIEVGVNSALQKQMALDTIIKLMGSSETFAAFINQDGLESLLDNVDIRGIEELKLKSQQFMQQMKQMQQQSAGKPSPEDKLIEAEREVEMARIEQRREQSHGELAVKAATVATDKEKADMEFIRLLSEIEMMDAKTAREAQQMDADLTQGAVEMALSVAQHHVNNEQQQFENNNMQNNADNV